jgi:hypothetical protein
MSMLRSLSGFGVLLAVLAAPLANALLAQRPALDDVYDRTKQVVVKGMLIGSATPRPPYSVYLLLSAEDAKGNIEHWAVEGDSIAELHKRGHKDDALKMGEILSVAGHPAREGRRPEDRMPKPVRGALGRAFHVAKEGRLIYGTEITLPDGTKVPFGRMK